MGATQGHVARRAGGRPALASSGTPASVRLPPQGGYLATWPSPALKPGLVLAGGAIAAKDDLVVARVEAEATRHAVDRALEIAVVEGHQAPARIAQQMVVVDARGIDQLVAGHRIPQLQPRDQSSVVQEVEDAIDARARHPAVAATQAIFDLEGGQRARLAREQVDDRVSRAPRTMARLVQHGASVLRPLRSVHGCHGSILAFSETASC